jgi:hypothetical protein
MKKIIALSAPSNTGKTTILKLLWKKISNTSVKSGDITERCTIEGNVVSIISCGDPGTDLENRLAKELDDADWVVCACRTRGETPKGVENCATRFNAKIYWISPIISSDESVHDYGNNEISNLIYNLIKNN